MQQTTETKTKLDTWAVLELFGHRRFAGRVTEEEIAGKGFIRIDVPGTEGGSPASTHFYGPDAVYGIHPCSEELARAAAKSDRPAPVHRYELPAPRAEEPEDVDEVDCDDKPW
ncbi:MAG: acetyltransferase [Deltaproteobacteria bacterium]|nr:acetyltransferase [Deltaproteobacteria bacterium]